jgi:hypothetical protein
MARNRRTQSGALRLVPAIKTALLVMFIGSVSVGYVVQKNKLHDLGRQIMEREARLERLKWDNKLRASQLADLQLPQKLADRVRELNLGLGPVQPGQTVWLPEPSEPKRTNQAQPLFVFGR